MFKKQTNNYRKKIESYSYSPQDKIGRGYSSQVYRGRNDNNNEEVAIKVIDMKLIKGDTHRNLLQDEIEVLKLFKNPDNVIEVFDIYKTKDYTYIITQYCKDGDLSKIIKQGLPEHQAIQYLKQIVSGYMEICRKRIVHRDLKPANILLKNKKIKIADFGFATRQYEMQKKFTYNVGSPIYMPPQSLNDNVYSFKSDIWAIGIIFFEMLTGKTPWRAKTEKDLGKMLKTIPIQKILPKDISEESMNFFLKTLNFDPASRMNPHQLEEEMKFFPCSELRKCKSSSIVKHLPQKSDLLHERNSQGFKSSMKKLTKMNFHPQGKEQFKNYSLPKTAASIKNKTEKDLSSIIFDTRQTSKEILSQIHFCRFIYKLSQRITKHIPSDTSRNNLREGMLTYVFLKLSQIKNLRFLEYSKKKIYISSEDFNKIKKIVEQYESKYQKQTNFTAKSTISEEISSLKQPLKKFLKKVMQDIDMEETQEHNENYTQKIIIIDYLITLKQLIDLQERGSIGEFHSGSDIQKIVEGNPVTEIRKEHLKSIMAKLQKNQLL